MHSEETLQSKGVNCKLVIDTSSSMAMRSGGGRSSLDEINSALPTLLDRLRAMTQHQVDVGIITFSGDAEVHTDFTDVQQLASPLLTDTGGSTNLGAGVSLGMDALEAHTVSKRNNGFEMFQPWMILMTDGVPNRNTAPGFEQRLVEAVQKRQFHLIPVAIGEAAVMQTLDDLSPLVTPLHITDGANQDVQWDQVFEFISKSMESDEIGSKYAKGRAVDAPNNHSVH